MSNDTLQAAAGPTGKLLDDESGRHGLGVLWIAIHRLQPELSGAFAMGMLNALGRYGFCSRDRCCPVWPLTDQFLTRLPAIGLRAEELQIDGLSFDEAVSRIRKLVNKGISLIGYTPHCEGILVCETPDQLRFDYLRTSTQATWVSTAPDAALLANARIFAIRRSSSPLAARSRRERFALANWAAAEVLPPIECVYRSNRNTELVARGLSAYEAASSALAGSKTWRSAKQIDGWAEFMVYHRAACSEYLFGLAGRSKSRYHNRLREAGNWYIAEVEEGINPLRALLNQRRRIPHRTALQQAQDLLQRAGECAAHAHCALLEAVVIGMHLSPLAASALLHDPLDPLHGMELQELVYLARAGLNPIRQLAARRLAGSNHPQSIATLRQLVFDPDPETSQMSQWSLGRVDPEVLKEVVAVIQEQIITKKSGTNRQ